MILEYIFPDNKREFFHLSKTVQKESKWHRIKYANKLEFILSFFALYNAQEKIVLFDPNHKQLEDFYESHDINEMPELGKVESAQLLFFTSGSSGFPLGAFKSKDHLEKEIKVLENILSAYPIKRVVVTVPFVHIYGVLAGLLLPFSLKEVTLVVKDDFLPYELLSEASHINTLVITTPVFIKALSKLQSDVKLDKTLFISSTGPLDKEDIILFTEKFETQIFQLFGSTETGGIAYKIGVSDFWKSLDSVEVNVLDDKLTVKSPFISKFLLDGEIHTLSETFETEDIISCHDEGFVLLGRSNKLIKIAGKRISALQVEAILETIPYVEKAIVELVYKKELLRSEQMKITLQSSKNLIKSDIKNKISEHFGVLTIPFSIEYSDNITYSSMGKKIMFDHKISKER
jgi:acyl-coenzyme A synthetase/AMP-(fatty) acid ligase